MKKIIKVLLILLLILVGCNQKSDAITFKQEYEALNNQTSNSGKAYKEVNIPSNNPMKYASFDEIEKLLTEGTGLIYFGFPECPWCRSMLETFIKVCNDRDIKEVLYYNNLDQRDIRKLVDNKIVVEKEGTDEYYHLLDLLGENASVYGGLNDDSIKRLYFPTIVAVKEGKIVGYHQATLPEVEDPYLPLTDKQLETLYQIYDEMIVTMTTCDISGC